jgi:hypothetical protein
MISFDYTAEVIEKSLRQIIKSYKQGNGNPFSGMPTIRRRDNDRFYDCIEVLKLSKHKKMKFTEIMRLMGWEKDYKDHENDGYVMSETPVVSKVKDYKNDGAKYISDPFAIM